MEVVIKIGARVPRRFRSTGYGDWMEQQRWVRNHRQPKETIHLPYKHKGRIPVEGLGLVEVLLELDTDTSLLGVARWFGNNPKYSSGNKHLSLVLEHLCGRLKEIVEETIGRDEEGCWTDRATAVVQAINPEDTFFLPGKVYQVASLKILPPQKLALADE